MLACGSISRMVKKNCLSLTVYWPPSTDIVCYGVVKTIQVMSKHEMAITGTCPMGKTDGLLACLNWLPIAMPCHSSQSEIKSGE